MTAQGAARRTEVQDDRKRGDDDKVSLFKEERPCAIIYICPAIKMLLQSLNF